MCDFVYGEVGVGFSRSPKWGL